ncbi:putative DNA processing Smf-like protein [Porphyromonas sp. CAG:1061]|uniref:DNA-processing protein DprA n=1 Tax=Porphyromonas sp. CAG:1061 TaxID=1262916 RepID=UPI00033D1413|nr:MULTISPECIES: DNA-processing protein DprA [environmental samples]CCY11073.1 putative DNA processing Smf-like protein [Porphyromonas sp. CAG:1061]
MESSLQFSSEQLALLQLSLTEGIGPVTAKALIEEMGSAEAVMAATPAELMQHPNIRPKLAQLLLSGNGAELAKKELEILEELQQRGRPLKLYFFGDEEYPPYLAQCFDAPLVLYVKGQIPLGPMISFVGTRRNTHYSLDVLEYLMEGIAALRPDITIVSGLAYGVDKLSHQTALKYGLKSIGVVAHGHYTLYPSSHRDLAEQMIATGGGVVTEYPYRTRALPQRFVQRNRIVAGLSLGTVVVESAERGGSLITANIAFDYGRSVLVAPGRIFDTASKGCNKLVAHQKASIITTPDKLLDELQLLPTLKPQRLPFEEEQEESNPILKALRTADHLTLEDLALQLGEEVPTISGMLFELELNGQIHSLPGGRYCIKNH